jgi:putative MFS transporter
MAIENRVAAALPHEITGPGLIARFERVPFSGWHTRARITVGSAALFDAFDALSIAFVMPVLVNLWQLSKEEVGFLLAAGYVGQVIGALLFSRLAETHGRIPCAAAAVAIMSVLSLACALCAGFWQLLVCRLLQGIGVGGLMPVAATYIGELSRARGRGRFFLLYEMIFPVGLMLCGQVATLLVPLFGWRIMFLIGGIPGLLICVPLLRLPESPRWLISRGRLAEAEAILRQVEASTPRRDAVDVARPASDGTAACGRPKATRWRELLSPPYRRRSLIVWTLWTAAYLVTNSINNWAPTLYHAEFGLPLASALRAGSLNNVAQVAVLLICAFVIDRIGRRNWMMAVFLAGGAMLAFLGIVGAPDTTRIVTLITLSYGILGSANAVLYLYTPEIYPTRMRAIGVGIGTFWLRVASATGPLLVGFMFPRAGVGAVFLMFAAVSVLGAIVASRMMETSGRRLEDIAA